MLKEVGQEQEWIKLFLYAAKMLHSHIYHHRGGKDKVGHH